MLECTLYYAFKFCKKGGARVELMAGLEPATS